MHETSTTLRSLASSPFTNNAKGFGVATSTSTLTAVDTRNNTFPLIKKSSPNPSVGGTAKSWNSIMRLGLGAKSLSLTTPSSRVSRSSTKSQSQQQENIIHCSSSLPDLPERLWIAVLAYLTPQDLCKFQATCRALHPIALSASLWQTHCILEKIHCGPGIEQILERVKGNRGRWWKEIYIEGMIGRNNMIYGHHKKLLIEVTDPKDAITCFKYDQDKIAVGTKSHRLMLLKPQSPGFFEKPKLEAPFLEFSSEVHQSAILCIDFDSPVGSLLATGDASGCIAIWNLFNGQLLARKKKAHDKGISSLMTLGSTHIVSCGFDKMVRLYRLEKNNTLAHLPQDSSLSIASSKTKKPNLFKRIFFKKKLGKVALPSKLVLVKEFQAHRGEIYCITPCIKKSMFATGSTDKHINLYDVMTGDLKRVLKGHTDAITCLVAKGEFLFSGSLDCVIRKWNCSTGQCISLLVGHSKWIKTLTISGTLLLSGGWDETLFLWNLEKAVLEKRIKLNMGPISCVQANETKVIVTCREAGFQNQLVVIDFGFSCVGLVKEIAPLVGKAVPVKQVKQLKSSVAKK